MTRLVWDDISEKSLSYGVDRGVLYPPGEDGIAWSGLVDVTEQTDSYEARSYFLDGQQVRQDPITGDFAAAITAFTYPDQLDEVQATGFGMSYRTKIVTETEEYYKIHILYDVVARSQDLTYTTIGSQIDPILFKWDVSGNPVIFENYRSTNHLVIDSRHAYPWLLKELFDELHGTNVSPPRLPSIEDLFTIFEENVILKITDHGDGTWTADGPPVYFISETEFGIDWESLVYTDSHTYTVRSF